MKNIDEWLCNLYIQVKKIELFDFRYHEEKIEFLVPKKWQKALEVQKKMNEELIASRIHRNKGDSEEDNSQEKTRDESDNSDEAEDKTSDYSSSDGSVDSDLGYDAVGEAL